jgi:hypothetical protein
MKAKGAASKSLANQAVWPARSRPAKAKGERQP